MNNYIGEPLKQGVHSYPHFNHIPSPKYHKLNDILLHLLNSMILCAKV